ncbi:MAG: hypothetical protein IT236_14785 [Bacteroidia bacterium]|nr:hypothetical protein [Bacteroidia bacterium]
MKKLLLLACLLFNLSHFYSQDLDLKWSEQFQYDNKLDGFFDAFIGTNNNLIYAKFTNLALSPKKQNKKIKLIAFDKNTMKKVSEVELKGYDDKNNDKDYYKTIILNDIIYVIWTQQSKHTVEVLAQSFDTKLKKIAKTSKIYEINAGKNGYDNLVVIANPKVNSKLLVLKEFEAGKDESNLKIEYKIINPDFSSNSSKQIKLPILVSKKRKGLFRSSDSFNNNICTYEYGEDGNLYIQDMVRLNEDEKKLLKKGEASVYPHIIQVKPENGNIQEYRLKFPKKNTFNYSSKITSSGVKLYGFFSDLDKDEKGRDTHGLFLITLDNNDFSKNDKKFSYFSKSFLDQLYAADKENQKRGSGLFKSKKDKASDDESIDDNYIIEQVLPDGKDIVLFCSIMRNWSRTVCNSSPNGGTSCNTYYYCTKSNVTAFKLNDEGDILWAKNLDRQITYNRWNVYDLNVVKGAKGYCVVYGSAYQINAKDKNRRSVKKGRQQIDRFEYAVFSDRNGEYKKAEYQVNKLNVKKKDAKFVKQDNIF